MAAVQLQFDAFNQTIRLGRFDEDATLREKRDIIRKKLREELSSVFTAHGETAIKFDFADQGSYAMGTGVKPLDGEYDIDQGVYFKTSIETYPDPVTLKLRVAEALTGHTKEVRVRTPCVTVFYQRDGEHIYHVDLAIYSDGAHNLDGIARLARGKEFSLPENRVWEESNAQGLKDTLFARFTHESDRKQFRHIVRYLKRWKGVNFSAEGTVAPLGIGLTVATADLLQNKYSDWFTRAPDDLGALRELVDAMLNRFISSTVWEDGKAKFVRRLVVHLPVQPYNDLFAKMTDKQMESFEEKIKTLRVALTSAAAAVDPVDASETLREVFGDDFPVPPKSTTGKRHGPAIVSSSNSA